MAGGPSINGTITSSATVSSFMNFTSSTSPPKLSTTVGPASFLQYPYSASASTMDLMPSILIRNLPSTTTIDILRSMLLFSKGIIDVNFADDDHSSAVARFESSEAANEAKLMLNGKSLNNDSNYITVELHNVAPGRKKPLEGMRSNAQSSSNSSISSSRYTAPFQSPPLGNETKLSNFFLTQSPLGTTSSKNLINDDPSDETTKLLNETLAFGNGEGFTHRGSQIPISRMAGLSLNTTATQSPVVTSPLSAMASPHSLLSPSQTPNPAMSPNPMSPHMNNNSYMHFGKQHYPPPVNPADQNPPCNTLYVGNLPMDTSEDELKALFSKQRGYKRLCFRTKAQGPMCFVEFEDTSFATRTLKELYGYVLTNSVKGGIRLSFSKNPLGVRSVQNVNNHTIHSVNNTSSAGGPPTFTTASGPPPGLPPPGFPHSSQHSPPPQSQSQPQPQAGLGINGPPGLTVGHNQGLGVNSIYNNSFNGLRQPVRRSGFISRS